MLAMIICATMVSVLGTNILNRESLDSSIVVAASKNLYLWLWKLR